MNVEKTSILYLGQNINRWLYCILISSIGFHRNIKLVVFFNCTYECTENGTLYRVIDLLF